MTNMNDRLDHVYLDTADHRDPLNVPEDGWEPVDNAMAFGGLVILLTAVIVLAAIGIVAVVEHGMWWVFHG